MSHTVTAKIVQVAGNSHLSIKNYNVTLNPEDVQIRLTFILIHNFLLRDANDYLSKGNVSMEMFRDTRESFEKYYAKELKYIVNRSLGNLTFNDIFSPNNNLI